MAKTDFKTADEYIQTFPKDIQDILEQVRQTIQKAVPEAEEVISYQIPAFKFHGWIFYYSAYKKHFSLSCPPPYTFVEAFKKELSGYNISKSTIQFPFDKGVPVNLIHKMSQYRAKENLARESKAKQVPTKTRKPNKEKK
jgi:uncharacterized protein YdhG (YjbR/CyaY superfamily)